MTFAAPAFLLLAVAWLAAMIALELWERKATRQRLALLGEAPLVARLVASSSLARRAVRRALLGASGALLCVALARPQLERATEVRLAGRDVVLALDVSTSMLVDDIAPTAEVRGSGSETTRLALARALLTNLVDELGDDRIGPVVFAGAATHFPLTGDHEVALQFLRDIGPADLPRGSDLGEALRVARCLLRRELFVQLGCGRVLGRRGDGGRPLTPDSSGAQGAQPGDLTELEERARVIVVISDGGEDVPAAAAELARLDASARVPVIFVGVGSSRGGQVFDIDEDGRKLSPKRDSAGQPVISRRGDEAMRALAEAAGQGSRYLLAPQDADPREIIAALRELPRGLTTSKARRRQDVFHPLVLGAILLLLIQQAIGTRRRRWPAHLGPAT